MSIDDFSHDPENIFELSDKQVLEIAKAYRIVRKTFIPENILSNEIYKPTNFTLYCEPYIGSKKISKGERKCKEILEKIYELPFSKVRPEFITHKRNLELDLFCSELGIAVEYHGKQHYNFPSRYIKRKFMFVEQLRRDIYKILMCRKMGIYLIVVPYTVKLDKIENYIRERLPECLG